MLLLASSSACDPKLERTHARLQTGPMFELETLIVQGAGPLPPFAPIAVAVSDSTLYVSDGATHRIFALASGKLKEAYNPPTRPNGPSLLAVSADDSQLFVGAMRAKLFAIDLASSATRSLPIPELPGRIMAVGKMAVGCDGRLVVFPWSVTTLWARALVAPHDTAFPAILTDTGFYYNTEAGVGGLGGDVRGALTKTLVPLGCSNGSLLAINSYDGALLEMDGALGFVQIGQIGTQYRAPSLQWFDTFGIAHPRFEAVSLLQTGDVVGIHTTDYQSPPKLPSGNYQFQTPSRQVLSLFAASGELIAEQELPSNVYWRSISARQANNIIVAGMGDGKDPKLGVVLRARIRDDRSDSVVRSRLP